MKMLLHAATPHPPAAHAEHPSLAAALYHAVTASADSSAKWYFMDEVAERSKQTVYHLLKSIVSRNIYLVSGLHSKLTAEYTFTVDKKMDELPSTAPLAKAVTSCATTILYHALAFVL